MTEGRVAREVGAGASVDWTSIAVPSLALIVSAGHHVQRLAQIALERKQAGYESAPAGAGADVLGMSGGC